MGAFKLGKMTFGSLFKKPETVLYPFESKPQPTGLKGHIVIDVNTCILCGMCERNCTTGCITVDKAARSWSINPYSCIQCGYCTTVCPKKCLHMDPNHWAAAPKKETQHFTVPERVKEKTASGERPAEPSKSAKAENPSKPVQASVAPSGEASVKGSPELQDAQTTNGKQAAQAAQARSTEPDSAMPSTHDAQLENLIAHLDAEKAKIVESALAGR